MENTPENCHLWEELSEAKAVVKDNAHKTGWIKEKKTQKTRKVILYQLSKYI